MKKTRLFLISMCIFMLTAGTYAATSGHFSYTDNGDGTCTLTGCAGLTGQLIIPDSVTTLGDVAFGGCTGLTGVYFKGVPPALGGGYVFYNVTATAYYLPAHAADWPATFGGLTTAVWPDINADGDINFADFAIFAAAWQSASGDAAYNPRCDLSTPANGVIDTADLQVLADYWLITPYQ